MIKYKNIQFFWLAVTFVVLALVTALLVRTKSGGEPVPLQARQQNKGTLNKGTLGTSPHPESPEKAGVGGAADQAKPDLYLPPAEVIAVRGAWQPFNMNLELKGDVQAGLQLNNDELSALRKTIDYLLLASGVIQAEDVLFSEDGEGNPLIYLTPVPSKWAALKTKFETDLKNSIGDAKAAYFLKSGALALNAMTGDFGKTPRLIRLKDNREYKTAVPDHPRIKNWTAGITAEMAQTGFNDYFKPETRSAAPTSSNHIFFEADITFDNPPPFLQPLIEIQK